MLLVVDIGNTNVTLALIADGAIVTTRRAGTPRSATADELEVLLAGLIGLDGRGMLVHQGARAFTIWLGQPAPVAVMSNALDRALSPDP